MYPPKAICWPPFGRMRFRAGEGKMKMTQENENGTLCPETDRKKFEEGGPSSKEQKADPDSLMDLRPPESIKVKT